MTDQMELKPYRFNSTFGTYAKDVAFVATIALVVTLVIDVMTNNFHLVPLVLELYVGTYFCGYIAYWTVYWGDRLSLKQSFWRIFRLWPSKKFCDDAMYAETQRMVIDPVLRQLAKALHEAIKHENKIKLDGPIVLENEKEMDLEKYRSAHRQYYRSLKHAGTMIASAKKRFWKAHDSSVRFGFQRALSYKDYLV